MNTEDISFDFTKMEMHEVEITQSCVSPRLAMMHNVTIYGLLERGNGNWNEWKKNKNKCVNISDDDGDGKRIICFNNVSQPERAEGDIYFLDCIINICYIFFFPVYTLTFSHLFFETLFDSFSFCDTSLASLQPFQHQHVCLTHTTPGLVST